MNSRLASVFVCLSLGVSVAVAAPPGTFTLRIAVDQFGYLPDLPKVAVISDPQIGFNAAESYTPGGTLEVRTWDSNTVVFSGAPVAWPGAPAQRTRSPETKPGGSTFHPSHGGANTTFTTPPTTPAPPGSGSTIGFGRTY
jgi:hypothetical protein